MGQYKEAFEKRRIDGAQILDLNNRTLLALGINNLVHRKQLLKGIHGLQELDFNNYSVGASSDFKSRGTYCLCDYFIFFFLILNAIPSSH